MFYAISNTNINCSKIYKASVKKKKQKKNPFLFYNIFNFRISDGDW